MDAPGKLVSIIVPTLNSAKFLERCLVSLKAQTYPNIEIILVDNFSKDATIEIAKKFTDSIYQIGPERSTQINFGFSKAKGDYLYRVDSDFVVDKDVVNEAVSMCGSGYDALCIPNISDPSVSFWSKVRNFERNFYVNDTLNVAARFLTRKVYEDVGGFDETLIAGEDYDLHNRILKKHYRIGMTKATEMHLGEPATLMEVLRKHYYYGKSIKSFTDKNEERGMKQISVVRPSFLRGWREFYRHPDMAVGFFVYQASRYSASMLGVFSTLFRKRKNGAHD